MFLLFLFPPLHSSQFFLTSPKDVIGGCRHRQEVCFLSLQSKHSKHSTSQDSTRMSRHVPQLIRSLLSAIWCLDKKSGRGFVWCNLVQLPVNRAIRCVCVRVKILVGNKCLNKHWRIMCASLHVWCLFGGAHMCVSGRVIYCFSICMDGLLCVCVWVTHSGTEVIVSH